MNVSARELILGWLTALAVLVGLTFWIGDPVRAQLNAYRDQLAGVEEEIDDQQRLLDLGPRWQARLEASMASLPRHAAGVDVTATLLREIETQAARVGLALAERRAAAEETHAEYSSLEISCRGSASLEAAVSFLYHLQSPAALLEVTQLRIESDKTDYRVRLTVHCVYGRNP